MLTKWFIPPALVAAPLLLEVGWRLTRYGRSSAQGRTARRVGLFALGFLVAGAVIVPWFVLLERQIPGALRMLFNEVVYSTEPLAHIPEYQYSYYFYKLANGLLPWTVLLLCALSCYLYKRWRLEWEPATVMASGNLRFRGGVGAGRPGLLVAVEARKLLSAAAVPRVRAVGGYVLSRLDAAGGRAEEALAWSQLAIGTVVGLTIVSLPLWIKLIMNDPDRQR